MIGWCSHSRDGLHLYIGCGRTLWVGCKHLLAAFATSLWFAVDTWLSHIDCGLLAFPGCSHSFFGLQIVIGWLCSQFTHGLQMHGGFSHTSVGLHIVLGCPDRTLLRGCRWLTAVRKTFLGCILYVASGTCFWDAFLSGLLFAHIHRVAVDTWLLFALYSWGADKIWLSHINWGHLKHDGCSQFLSGLQSLYGCSHTFTGLHIIFGYRFAHS